MPAAEKKFVLTHVVKDVLSLNEDGRSFSITENHFNVPWNISVRRKEEFLGLYLHCYQPRGSVWSISTVTQLKLVSSIGKIKSQAITSTFKNDHELTGSGLHKFIKWEDMEKEYMIDGNVIIKINVKILKMTGIEKKKLRIFDESMKDFSDAVLIVEGQKFYVSKLFLSCQSTHFEALFLRKFEESEKSEITLKDVDSKGFQNFLELLYGESPIDEDTVEGIVKLADMYDAKLAIRKCEDFLINESEKTLKEKLQMAKKYNLENLKNECLFKINTAAEIRSVLSYDTNEMDPSVVGALLQKSLSLIPYPGFFAEFLF